MRTFPSARLLALFALFLIGNSAFAQFKYGAQFMLVSAASGKVLDVGTDKVASLARPNSQKDNVCVLESDAGQNQIWRIEPAGRSTFRVVSVLNGKVLSVGCDNIVDPDNPNTQRDNVCVLDWDKDDNQRWKIERMDDGSWRFTACHNDEALTVGLDDVIVRSRPMARRDNACVLNWEGTPNQRWFIIQVPAAP